MTVDEVRERTRTGDLHVGGDALVLTSVAGYSGEFLPGMPADFDAPFGGEAADVAHDAAVAVAVGKMQADDVHRLVLQRFEDGLAAEDRQQALEVRAAAAAVLGLGHGSGR